MFNRIYYKSAAIKQFCRGAIKQLLLHLLLHFLQIRDIIDTPLSTIFLQAPPLILPSMNYITTRLEISQIPPCPLFFYKHPH